MKEMLRLDMSQQPPAEEVCEVGPEQNSNCNRSSAVQSSITEQAMKEALEQAKRSAEKKKLDDEKELEEVTKKIAGETFALVKRNDGGVRNTRCCKSDETTAQ